MSVLSNKGFTLIELMLAMTLFIFVMTVATVGFVGINRTFTKGMVRKDLSEGVQQMVQSIESTVRNEGEVSINLEERVIKSNKSCFSWPNDGGMFKKFCGQDKANGVVILDERFVVEQINVSHISENLRKIEGLVRTNDNNAFMREEKPVGDNSEEKVSEIVGCKSRTMGGSTDTCAFEKFSFIVDVSGGSI